MAFCNMCGTQIPDGTTTCVPCSSRAAAAPPAAPPAAVAAPVAGAGLQDNVAGMLAYITFVPAIIFLVMEPYNRNRFIRFHAFQCLFLYAAAFVGWIALAIISIVLAFIPILGHLVAFLLWMALSVGLLIAWIICLLKANSGLMYKLPIIGDLAEKQG